jgi:Aldo/keto reductase family
VENALEQSERAVDRRRASTVDAELSAVGVHGLPGDVAQPLASEVRNDPSVEKRRVRRERARAQVRNRVRVPPLDQELLERRVRTDDLRSELTELACAAKRGVEELRIASTVERALTMSTAAAALVPADDVDGAAIAPRAPLNAHAGCDRSRFAKDTPDRRAWTVSGCGSGGPAGRGFLTGRLRSRDQLDSGDFRSANPRFAEGNFEHNLRIVDEVETVAAEAGATPSQVALAWLLAQGDDIAPIPGTKHIARVEENAAADALELTAEQLGRLTAIEPPVGDRYADMSTVNR